MSDAEQRRRWLIKSLFRSKGLDRIQYRSLFHSDPAEEFAELAEMIPAGYFTATAQSIKPTALGLAWSDALAPMLFSPNVQARSGEFELR